MERDWMKVYTTKDKFEANLLEGLLKSKGIRVVVLNKQDSAYIVFGELELYTHISDASEAMSIIKEHKRSA
jgi:hypothetical protein